MPLQLSSLDPSDRDQIAALPLDPTEEQLRDMAQRLLSKMTQEPRLVQEMVLQVRRLVSLRQNGVAAQAANQANLHYTFSRPHRSATPLHPVFEQWKVLATEFAAFCKEFEVSESGMLAVAHGEVDSFKSWRQGMAQSTLETRRAKVIAERNPHPAGIAGPFFVKVAGKGNWDGQAAPVYLPATWWHPSD